MIDRLRRFLDDANVQYQTLPHREAFTAQEIAASTHVSGRQLAKSVIVKGESGGFYMAVIPAASRLDLDELARTAGERTVTLANERELQPLFPDCETGAMPPFGGLYGIPVYLDRSLALGAGAEAEGPSKVPDIVFEAGNHHEAVRMRFSDYVTLARPTLGVFSYPWISPPQPEIEAF